jgi:hypothetical protein
MGCQSHMTKGLTKKCWLIDAYTLQHYRSHSHAHRIQNQLGAHWQHLADHFLWLQDLLTNQESKLQPCATHCWVCQCLHHSCEGSGVNLAPLRECLCKFSSREPPPSLTLTLAQQVLLTLMLIAPVQGLLAIVHTLALAREHPPCYLALSLLTALMLVAPAQGVLAFLHVLALASLALLFFTLLTLMLHLTLLALMLVAPAGRVLALVNVLTLKREPPLT